MNTETVEAAAVEPDVVTEVALVDLSSIAHPLWHMSSGQPDPDWTSTQIVDRVRTLTANFPKAAICCDKGKSFRHDLSPSYKANRPAQEATLHHQIRVAKERLEADGYPVWAIDGFEADDLIATAATALQGIDGTTVRIFSADKDLMQLVGPRVVVESVTTGVVYDAAEVRAKFGVDPAQIRDYLSLVGDPSDNVKGAKGIGGVKAADLLAKYPTLEAVYEALTNHGTEFKPAMATALREFEPRMAETRTLITLRTDAPIPFADLDNERTPKYATAMEDTMGEQETPTPTVEQMPPSVAQAAAEPVSVPVSAAAREPEAQKANGNGDALIPAPSTAPFERQLEPRSLAEAGKLSTYLHQAAMFSGYGSPQAVLSTILAGRELGMQAVASLRAFHNIDGKHALAADAMRALVLRSGQAKYFRCVERTPERATFETLRDGDPGPVALTYTIEEGRAAFKPELPEQARASKWQASAWGKHPADMLAARASSKLARLVYADILFGLYAPEELRD